jgi:amino acid adenylation domain-containing protein
VFYFYDIYRISQYLEFERFQKPQSPLHLSYCCAALCCDGVQVSFQGNQTSDVARDLYPRDACIHHLFEAQVKRTPDAVALVCGEVELSYRQLNERANKLAHELMRLGVGPNSLVGICVERSPEMVVALLATLKAGGAYVPLDPTYPRDRLAFMLNDAHANVLLTQSYLVETLPSHGGPRICLDSDWKSIEKNSTDNLNTRIAADSLAYVIYTSGSTGQPKGAMITHRGLTNYLNWATEAYAVADGCGAPVHSSISFDLTVTSLFTPLVVGRSVFLLPDGIEALATALTERSNYSLLKITPAHLRALAALLPADDIVGRVRALIIGGEALHFESLSFWRRHAPATRIINEYGPTETVVGCCVYEVRANDPVSGPVPIGTPIPNTELYVLDDNFKRVASDETGELFIGGAGVARGYLNREKLTRERFVANPLGYGCLYRSGDLARVKRDGNFEYLGRLDDQIKIRGFRVELGEIEAVLKQHDAISDCAVIAKDEEPGQKRVIAFVIPNQSPTIDDANLASFLKTKLPEYMIPAAFIQIPILPLTINGKVNYQALPALRQVLEIEQDREVTTSRTPTEIALAELWSETLNLDEAGIDQKFFDLGGDSLQAVGLVLSVEQKLNKRLPLAMVETGSIRSLAAVLDRLPLCGNELSEGVVPMDNRTTLGKRPTLFFVPGETGDDLSCYLHVVANLPQNQPIYGLQPPALIGTHEFETIEETAYYYVQRLRHSQPSGPYFLCGFCFGGLVAFEMAQQLQVLGEEVAFLGVLDQRLNAGEPEQFDWRPRSILKFSRNIFYAAADFLEVKKERKASFRRLLRKLAKYGQRIWTRNDSDLPEIKNVLLDSQNPAAANISEVQKRLRSQQRAWRRYQPRNYAGPITLFRSRRLPLGHFHDETLGWSKIATGDLEVQKVAVPGFQGYMLRPPYASILAESLDHSLEVAQKKSAFPEAVTHSGTNDHNSNWESNLAS